MALCILFACKKDKQHQTTLLLSKSMSNGHIVDEFLYSPDSKLVRYNLYTTSPTNVVAYYYIFEYNTDGIVHQYTYYKADGNVAQNRVLVANTINGQFDSAYIYDLQSATPNTPSAISHWTYNASGRLIKQQAKDKNGKLSYLVNFSYYPDGSLKQSDQYAEESGMLYLVEQKKIFGTRNQLSERYRSLERHAWP